MEENFKTYEGNSISRIFARNISFKTLPSEYDKRLSATEYTTLIQLGLGVDHVFKYLGRLLSHPFSKKYLS